MIGRLSSSKTLSVVDDAALYQYCQLFAETEAIATSQRDVKALMKILKQNLRDLEGAALVAAVQEIAKLQQLEARHATQRRQSRMAVRIYLVEFGLTPASRARVKIHDPAEHEPYNQPPETDAMVEFDTPPGLKLVKGRGGKRT